MAFQSDLRALRLEVGEQLVSHDRAERAVDLARYEGEVEAFAREVLHVEHITRAQRAHFRAVAEARRVAAYGGNGSGKTFGDAVLALYLVYAEGALVIATSSHERQLRDQLMRDMRILFERAPDLDGEVYTLGLRRTAHPRSGIIGVASSETSRVRGFHAPRLAFMVEEAQGCPEWIFETAEMMAIGEHDRVLVSGNCDQGAGGPFWQRCQTWRAIRFNNDDHPNLLEGRAVIPGGPTEAARAARVADYGEDSPFFQASWLGIFPEAGGQVLIAPEWIAAAVARWHASERMPCGRRPSLTLDPSRPGRERVRLTLDPSRMGPDSTAMAVRYGEAIEELIVWQHLRTTDSARRVVEEMARLGVPREDGIVVDEAGVGGGVVDALEDLGVTVRPYNGGRSPTRRGQETFANIRAESYWHLRMHLERGTTALPPDDLLLAELGALRWSEGGDGKITVEAKDTVRMRLGRSPDRADAVAMAFVDDGSPRLIA
jgi:phage terminase large subunit